MADYLQREHTSTTRCVDLTKLEYLLTLRDFGDIIDDGPAISKAIAFSIKETDPSRHRVSFATNLQVDLICCTPSERGTRVLSRVPLSSSLEQHNTKRRQYEDSASFITQEHICDLWGVSNAPDLIEPL